MGSTAPAKTVSNSLSFTCFFLGFLIPSINALGPYLTAQESDRVINLPDQPPSPSISHFSGYITVNQEHGRALFYWFFEALSQPSKKPLLLWLNGGPGCSSIAYGAASELGPLRVGKNGDGLHFNTYAWNKVANLLFVESPVGVGFSYTNTSSDLTNLDDAFVAEDAYTFLVNWFQRFPQFKTHDFFISGESYAGHYVPQLAELVYDRNKDSKYPFMNLKGFIVKDYGLRRKRIPAGDPCYSVYAEDYFNRADVQKSLHANTRGGKWESCSNSILIAYNFSVFSVLPIYKKLIKGNLKIWMYSGDMDGRVPVISSRSCVESLGLHLKSPWHSWFHNHQVGGRILEYQGLTFVTVRGAGHLVPLDKPSEALTIIHSFLSGEPLPIHRY